MATAPTPWTVRQRWSSTTNGRSVRLQKIANSAWATIADTKDEAGGGRQHVHAVEVQSLRCGQGHLLAQRRDLTRRCERRTGRVDGRCGYPCGQLDSAGEGEGIHRRLHEGVAGTVRQFACWAGFRSSARSAAGYNAGDLLIVGRGGATTVTFCGCERTVHATDDNRGRRPDNGSVEPLDAGSATFSAGESQRPRRGRLQMQTRPRSGVCRCSRRPS